MLKYLNAQSLGLFSPPSQLLGDLIQFYGFKYQNFQINNLSPDLYFQLPSLCFYFYVSITSPLSMYKNEILIPISKLLPP